MGGLRDRRVALGLSLRDVEQLTQGEISNGYLSQLETGKVKSPSVRLVAHLAAAYHVSMETVLDWLNLGPAISAPPLCPTCGRVMTEPKP